MKKLLFILWLSSVSAYAQNIRDYGVTKIRLNEPGRSIVMEVLPTNKPSLRLNRLYYWFSGNVIHTTQGGYSGKLLNGRYNEYFPSKSLKEQGSFDKGLKSGIWKTWTEDGVLTQEITWKEGVKNGEFTLYDEQGNIKQSGTFDDNQLNENVLTYHGKDSIQTVRYKAGVPVIKTAPSQSLWQKIKRFRFKKKATATNAG